MEIILVGGGGHCKACIDVIEQTDIYRIAGIVDVSEKLHQRIFGYEIIATDNELPQLTKEYENFLITVGQIKTPETRIKLFNSLKRLGAKMPVVVSPLSYVSRHAGIAEGTIVLHYALVNAGAKIGKNCIINTGVLIEHDAFVDDHCHIATDAVVNGGVKIGNSTFFGSNATAHEYIEIGKNCIIGAGAVATKDVPDFSIVVGVPTRTITRYKNEYSGI